MFRTLSNIYNGTISSDPSVTLGHLELCHIQNLRNIRNTVKHLCKSLCKPGIFRTLVYSETKKYSELCQASMM